MNNTNKLSVSVSNAQLGREAVAKGEKTFNTGKPCPTGHTSDRAAKSGVCMECNRLRSRRNNKTEERKEYMRNFMAEHRHTEQYKTWYKGYYKDYYARTKLKAAMKQQQEERTHNEGLYDTGDSGSSSAL